MAVTKITVEFDDADPLVFTSMAEFTAWALVGKKPKEQPKRQAEFQDRRHEEKTGNKVKSIKK